LHADVPLPVEVRHQTSAARPRLGASFAHRSRGHELLVQLETEEGIFAF
jgi:hypothetical protein